jgi:hypothetical protein
MSILSLPMFIRRRFESMAPAIKTCRTIFPREAARTEKYFSSRESTINSALSELTARLPPLLQIFFRAVLTNPLTAELASVKSATRSDRRTGTTIRVGSLKKQSPVWPSRFYEAGGPLFL